MPRYGVTTFLNPKEMQLVDRARKKLNNISRYKILRNAIMGYSKACLNEQPIIVYPQCGSSDISVSNWEEYITCNECKNLWRIA